MMGAAMTLAGAIVVATALAAGGRAAPGRRATRIVLWRGSIWFLKLLERYRVKHESHLYYTTSYGKRYRRYKIIIRDRRVVAWIKRHYPHDINRYFMRYRNIVDETLRSLKRITLGILNVVSEKILKRITGIKPYKWNTYIVWQYRRFVREIKPNWRGWLFMKRKKAQEALEKLWMEEY